jgi:hypothetical protein
MFWFFKHSYSISDRQIWFEKSIQIYWPPKVHERDIICLPEATGGRMLLTEGRMLLNGGK